MKIERLEFENINSLAGKFAIDFQELADAGIFVITGQTGAGKTSLLDAISFALYNETARQDGFSKDRNELMSHGTPFCSARVIFSANGKRYAVTTSHRRTKRKDAAAQFAQAERKLELLDEDGQASTIASQLKQVEREIGIITGLSFDNFKRCMMLAQGEFAAFLKANEKDRAEVLSTITGTEIYEQIGQKTQEHVAELNKAIDSHHPLPVLSADIRNEKEEERTRLLRQKEELRASAQFVRDAIKWNRDLQASLKKEKDAAARASQAESALKHFEESGEADHLRRAERAVLIQEQESKVTTAEKLAEQTDKAIAEALQKYSELENDLKQDEQCVADKQQEANQCLPQLAEMQQQIREVLMPLERQILRADTHYRNTDNDFLSRQAEAQQAEKDFLRDESEALSLTQRFAETSRELDDKKQDHRLPEILKEMTLRFRDWKAMATSPDSAVPSTDELRSQKKSVEEEYARLKEKASAEQCALQLKALESLLVHRDSFRRQQSQLAEAEQQQKQAQKALDGLPDIDAARTKEQRLRDIVDLHRKQAQIDDQLDSLYRDFKEGRLPSCPCCGSTVPTAERPAVRQSELQKAETDAKLAEQERQALEKSIQMARKALDQAVHAKEELTRQMRTSESIISGDLAILNLMAYPDDLENRIRSKQEDLNRFYALEVLRENLQNDLACAEKRALFHEVLPDFITERPTTIAEASQLCNRLKVRSDSYQQLIRTLDEIRQKKEAAEVSVQHRKTSVESARRKLDEVKQVREEAATTLRELRTTFASEWASESSDLRMNRLNAEEKKLLEALSHAKQNRDKRLNLLSDIRDQLERHRADRETQEQEKNIATENFCRAILAQGFETREDYLAAKQWLPYRDELTRTQQRLQSELQTSRELLVREQSELRQLTENRKTADDIPTLMQREELLKTESDRVDKELTDVTATLKKDDDAIRENKELEDRLIPLREQLSHWEQLKAILGDTKEGFKRYAQQITFDRLIECANRQLRNLTERYTLRQDRSKQLGLQVLDLYQDDENGRDCSNLSGGESFIVSLALALGLSQMSGSNTRIDTLFLDEGFGTLDAETLDKILNSLDALRAGGKLIGIITHVEQLRDRISQNIRVNKIGNSGRSTLESHPAVTAQPAT